MEAEKLFFIGAGKKATYVTVGRELGRILHHSEVSQFAQSHGSEVKRSSVNFNIEIVPPIPAKHLNKFGEALVSLAQTLDPSPPKPDYRINKVE